MSRQPRSWLFVPADSEKKIAKALESEADALIFDLEDAVSLADKDKARAGLVDFFRQPRDGYGIAHRRRGIFEQLRPRGRHLACNIEQILDADRNAGEGAGRHTDVLVDFVLDAGDDGFAAPAGTVISQRAQLAWSGEPDLVAWMERSRLNAAAGISARTGDPAMQRALTRLGAVDIGADLVGIPYGLAGSDTPLFGESSRAHGFGGSLAIGYRLTETIGLRARNQFRVLRTSYPGQGTLDFHDTRAFGLVWGPDVGITLAF